jgi:hypothetical protein
MAKNRYAVGTASRYEGGGGDERGTGQELEAGSCIHGFTPISVPEQFHEWALLTTPSQDCECRAGNLRLA